MPIMHYVCIRFKGNWLSDERHARTVETFDAIAKRCQGVRAARVFRNCVAREGNCHLMIELELEGEEALAAYLEHPLHQQYAAEIGPHILQKGSFDRLL